MIGAIEIIEPIGAIETIEAIEIIEAIEAIEIIETKKGELRSDGMVWARLTFFRVAWASCSFLVSCYRHVRWKHPCLRSYFT